MTHTVLRSIAGGFLLLVAVPAALAAGIAGFALTAYLTSSTGVLTFVGLACVLGVGALLAWPAFALLGTRRGGVVGLVGATALTIAAGLGAGFTVFDEVKAPAADPAPAGLTYWNLSTGSRI